MKSARTDQLVVTVLAAALTVWTGCLVVLWGCSFDTSGRSTLVALAAMFLAVRVAAPWPGRVARTTQRILALVGIQDALRTELAAAGALHAAKGQGRAMIRMMAFAAIAGVFCGVASTVAVFASSPLVDHLAGRFFWSPADWTILQLLVQIISMLPMAMGICVAFLAGAVLRSGSGRDMYAAAFRDWLWGLACGVALLAVLWWVGADLLGVVMATAVLMLAGAGGLFMRRKFSRRSRRLVRPIEAARQRVRRMEIATGFAALTGALLIQVRLLSDLGGSGAGACAMWVGLSVALLAVMLRRVDCKSRPPGQVQAFGAIVALPMGLMLQAVLLMLAASAAQQGWGAMASVLAFLAVAAQVPLAALAAIVLSRGRRIFANQGGRARAYFASSAAGAGAAALLFLVCAAVPAGKAVLLAIVLAVLAGGVVAALAHVRRAGTQARWALWGCLSMCSVTAALLGAIDSASGSGKVTAGVWLSGVYPSGAGALPAGVLPWGSGRRSREVSVALEEVMAASGGRWWVAAASSEDLPAVMPPTVLALWSPPDVTALPATGTVKLRLMREGGFLHSARLAMPAGQGRLFDGVLIAPLPADHPHAWRCYNRRTIEQCVRRLHPGGVMVLRTQAGGESSADALSVARTFHDVVGPSWAIIAVTRRRVDLMLAGPAERLPQPSSREGLFIVRSDYLFAAFKDVEPLQVTLPAGVGKKIDGKTLRRRLWRVVRPLD